MPFLETPLFPIKISWGTVGGPSYNTSVVVLQSGFEKRNQIWENSRGRWNVASGIRCQSELESLIDFFHAVRGRLDGFRFKDIFDFKSTNPGGETNVAAVAFDDQTIGTGDGTTLAFQLIKTYTQGALSTSRDIYKPVSGTVLVGIAGVLDPRWSVDTTTGIVTFSADLTDDVTNIANAGGGTTVVTIPGHGLTTGDTVHFSTFLGSSDWAALNGLRFTVTVISGSIFTFIFDSSTFAAYVFSTDGGTIHTIPQASEAVTAGYEFDVPVRFDIDHLPNSLETYKAGTANVPIIEIRQE